MTQVRAAVLVTGSEILIGRIVDTNSSWLARELEGAGVRLERIVAVDDREEMIVGALRELLASGVDLVLTSGGLGPTHDDRTVACVAQVAGVPLVLDEPTLARIDEIVGEFARARGMDPAAYVRGNRKQAMVPVGAEVLPPVGTAPGVILPVGDQRIVVLPGPPVELARMWPTAVASPLIAPLLSGALPRRVLRLYGVAESAIADAFEDLGGDGGGTETTICASKSEIEVVIRYPEPATTAAEHLASGLRERFGRAVFSEGPAKLEELVLDLLRDQGRMLATAESCTAGLVAARLAGVPGSSDVLAGGLITYSNELKQRLLQVPEAILAEHGAVSAECAQAMAQGARAVTGAEVAVSVTGIAGPGGATPGKPVGLVYVHVSAGDVERGLERRFPGPRENVRDWSATAALHLVRIVAQSA